MDIAESRGLDRNEAATRLGVSLRVLERLIAQRKIGYRRIGGRYFIPESEIDAYLARVWVQPELPVLDPTG